MKVKATDWLILWELIVSHDNITNDVAWKWESAAEKSLALLEANSRAPLGNDSTILLS